MSCGNITCPKCGSFNLVEHQRGFSNSNAIAGAAVLGTAGLAAGMIGKNDIELTCLDCGHQFLLKDYLLEKNYWHDVGKGCLLLVLQIAMLPLAVAAFVCLIAFLLWLGVLK